MTLEQELAEFPLTGRFLYGRLRDSLSHEDRRLLENLPEEIANYHKDTRVVQAGSASEIQTPR